MPELPEVETTVRALRESVVGRTIKNLWTDWPTITRHPKNIKEFARRIKNRRIVKVWRRAKFVILDIEGKESIFVHQKISGHLLYGRWRRKGKVWHSVLDGPLRDDPDNRFIRLVIGLDNGYQLALADQRRFGKIMLIDDEALGTISAVRDLGPEPFEVSKSGFLKLFKGKRGVVKQVLMDPKFIAGIGNIYADEILWASAVHPLSRVEALSPAVIGLIYKNMRSILAKAIRYQGTSMDDYRLPSGEFGKFQNMTRAYHETGNACRKKDGGVIERLKIGGRSAHFCVKHQHLWK